jgi:hypothetical protein
MPQKITVTGIPITSLRPVKLPKQGTAKVYSFDMQESGSSNAPKGLPTASDILFTIFTNDKQLRKAGIDANNISANKLLVQGEIVIDLNTSVCPGEFGVTAFQLQVIPAKADSAQSEE